MDGFVNDDGVNNIPVDHQRFNDTMTIAYDTQKDKMAGVRLLPVFLLNLLPNMC